MRAVSIRLYDSLLHETVEFSPRVPGEVSMYVCGPTVQSAPHIGHVRSALVYDLWWRWFDYRGHRVTLIRNITDIDDKILEKSLHTGEHWWALAQRVEREFRVATDQLRIRAPHLEPRATGDIPAMVEMIGGLIEAGHAYQAEDGSGDVYFDVASWPDYGRLTRQSPDQMEPGEETSSQKRSPNDFALWKGHKSHEPATAAWPAPWGRGRPGWHIECSAMATRYLGSEFDIHGGGLDLRFPHHENELAQATAAGHSFARHWLHNALVLVGGQKMSKSTGNSIAALDWLASTRPIIARYGLMTAHYRSDVDIHASFLTDASAAFARVETFLDRSRSLGESAGEVPIRFAEAMDDDLGTPIALAVVHDTVRSGNQALDSGDEATARTHRSHLVAMLDVLGINPASDEWRGESPPRGSGDALASVVEAVLARRALARHNKDFALSDVLRDLLAQSGITVDDTPDGSTWRIDG
jgi:cysteinyl-tRNA synthetase